MAMNPMNMANTLGGHKIGFVGLGNMGFAMAHHIHEAGAEVVVWNRSPERAAAAEASGMRRASSLADLARQIGDGMIGLCVTTTEVVRDVVWGAGGLHEALDPNALIIDFGTTGVPETREFARRTHWLDAPVSGGQAGAEAATLTIMVGGPPEAFDRARPVLEILGKQITHLGPSGAGQVAKLANQLIVAQTIDAVAQALRLAELAGLDPAQVRNALLGGFAQSRILQVHGERMIRHDFAAGGRAELQLKDVRLACELADSLGLDSPTLRNSLSQWERLVLTEGRGDLDHSALMLLYEPNLGSQ